MCHEDEGDLGGYVVDCVRGHEAAMAMYGGEVAAWGSGRGVRRGDDCEEMVAVRFVWLICDDPG